MLCSLIKNRCVSWCEQIATGMHGYVLPCLAIRRRSHPNSNLNIISDLVSLIFVQVLLGWFYLVFFKCLVDVLFSGHLPIFVWSPFRWYRLRGSLLLLRFLWEARWLAGLFVLVELLPIVHLWIPMRLFHLQSRVVSLRRRCESLRHMEQLALALTIFLLEEILLITCHRNGKAHVFRWNCIRVHRMFSATTIFLEGIFKVCNHLLEASRDVAFTSVMILRDLPCVVCRVSVWVCECSTGWNFGCNTRRM